MDFFYIERGKRTLRSFTFIIFKRNFCAYRLLISSRIVLRMNTLQASKSEFLARTNPPYFLDELIFFRHKNSAWILLDVQRRRINSHVPLNRVIVAGKRSITFLALALFDTSIHFYPFVNTNKGCLRPRFTRSLCTTGRFNVHEFDKQTLQVDQTRR